jgi:hypothetical protein
MGYKPSGTIGEVQRHRRAPVLEAAPVSPAAISAKISFSLTVSVLKDVAKLLDEPGDRGKVGA